MPDQEAPAAPAAPRALGSRYTLEDRLGTGAMGEVWRIRDRESGEALAAKLLRSEFTRDPAIVARFIQERSILVELIHPHIVRVRDLVVEGVDLAIVMDLVSGGDLRHELQARGRLDPATAVAVTIDVLDALSAAHSRNILHRDIKPDNVLLDALPEGSPPFARLSDFGIARLAQETTVKMTGLLGTAEYMAPEVLVDEVASTAADIYGTGVMLYELLAGHTPFTGGGNHYAVARRHELALPPRLPLPPALWDVLAVMLDKEPTRRHSAAATAAELRAVLPSVTGIDPLPPSPAPTAWASIDGRVLTSEHQGATGTSAGQPAPPTDGPVTPGGVAIRGGEAAPDAHQTFIRGRAPAAGAAALPVAGAPVEQAWQQALGAPSVDPNATSLGGAGSQTQLRGARTARDKVVDSLELVAGEERTRSRWRHPAVLAVAGIVVLGAVAGGVLASGVLGKKATKTPPKAVAPTTYSANAPSEPQTRAGLTIQRSAVFDPSKGVETTTITYATAANTLAGPFFEAVKPAEPSAACSQIVWDPSVQATVDTTQGIDPTDCGWQLPIASVTSGSPVSVTYSQPYTVPANGDVQGALTTYLAKEATATDTVLGNLADVPTYAPQRLTDLQIQVSGVPATTQALQVSVLPVWSGQGGTDTSDLLYSTQTPQTQLAQSLGGTVSVTSPDCGQAIQVRARRLYALSPAQNCTLTAALGTVTASAPSAPFDITLKG